MSVNGKTSNKNMTKTTRRCLVCLGLRRFGTLFFEVLPFTDDASVVNGKTSKKSMQKRRGGFWCVKPPRRFCMVFFDVLPFTDNARIVICKTSKKSVQNRRGGFWCVNAFKGLGTPEHRRVVFVGKR